MKRTKIFFLFSSLLWGSSFQIGVYVGYAPNPNQLIYTPFAEAGENGTTPIYKGSRKDGILKENFYLQWAKEGKNATIKLLSSPVGISGGVLISYLWNDFFLRVAVDFTALIQKPKGFLEYNGTKDEISYNTFYGAFYLSLGFSQQILPFIHFYLLGGPYYASSYLEVSHSNPSLWNSIIGTTPFYKKEVLKGDIIGLHVILGIATQVYKSLFISIEWLYQRGRSSPRAIEATDASGNPVSDNIGDFILQKEHKFLLGVSYQIPL